MSFEFDRFEDRMLEYFKQEDPNRTEAKVAKKIADEYKKAIEGGEDELGNAIKASSIVTSGLRSAINTTFMTMRNSGINNQAVWSAVGEATSVTNSGITLGFLLPDEEAGMVAATANTVLLGNSGSPKPNKLYKAFKMEENKTPEKTAELLREAFEDHAKGMKSLIGGTNAAGSVVTSNVSIS